MAAPAPVEPKEPTTWRQAVMGLIFAALVIGGLGAAAAVAESNDSDGGGHSEETDTDADTEEHPDGE